MGIKLSTGYLDDKEETKLFEVKDPKFDTFIASFMKVCPRWRP